MFLGPSWSSNQTVMYLTYFLYFKNLMLKCYQNESLLTLLTIFFCGKASIKNCDNCQVQPNTPDRCRAPGWLLTRCPRCWGCWPSRRGRSCWCPPSPPSSGSAEPSRPSLRTACRWTGSVERLLFMMFIFYFLVAVPVSQYAQHGTGGRKILCPQLSTKFCQGGWHLLCIISIVVLVSIVICIANRWNSRRFPLHIHFIKTHSVG